MRNTKLKLNKWLKGQSALNRYLNNHKFMSRISGVPFLPKSFAVSQLRKRNKSLNEKVRLCRQKYSTYTADSETPPPPWFCRTVHIYNRRLYFEQGWRNFLHSQDFFINSGTGKIIFFSALPYFSPNITVFLFIFLFYL